MRYFFTQETAQDQRKIADLQRRAVWIALALILLSLNEIDHGWYFPFLGPVASLIPLFLLLGCFASVWMALRTRKPEASRTRQPFPTRGQRVVLILTLILSIAGFIQFGRGIIMCFLPPEFSNDGTTLDTNAAMLLVDGRNPYTDSNMLDIFRNQHFELQPSWTTPLRQGQFADRLDYPSEPEIRSVLNTALKAGEAPEFESRVSYPALSFLTLLPFALLNTYNVLPFYILSYLLIIFVAWKAVHPALRPWALLLAMANIPMWASTVGGNLDIFCALLVILAWLFKDSRWLSGLFLGLAIATKQTSWFLVPFYFIMIFRNYDLKETLHRGSIAAAVALVFNLPFFLWDPQAFVAGVLAPIADPMFPMGIGIINLSVTKLIPFLPEKVYTVVEGLTMLGTLALYWRISRKAPEAALLLAFVPLIFAWRSLPSYFYCIAFPIYIVMGARINPALEKFSLIAWARRLVRTTQVPAHA
uniref:DUF2029 domain-containing protein n=1 Tax=Thermosporothrix sp. COM3 TaxID=2490863 RepID=A0A455SK95_9CHLR|nr:hypothetical protein KTC_35580 [Thermosporothrix sp. COM3]